MSTSSRAVHVAAARLAVLLALVGGASAQGGDAYVSTNCECLCKRENATQASTYSFAVRGREQCTDEACKSHFAYCPQNGSNNPDDDAVAIASYHDCTCSCCREGTCTSNGLVDLSFTAGSPDQCTPERCSSEFYSCPDPGAHNTDGSERVFATYHDCTCACCDEDTCPVLSYHMFWARSRDRCTADACRAEFSSCPDGGSHSGEHSVVATYTGIDPPAPPPQVLAPRRSFSIDAKSTEMPTYGAALLSIFIIGLVGTLVGIFVYRRIQAERGFKWVQYDFGSDQPKGPGAVEMSGNPLASGGGAAAAAAARPYEVGRV